MTRIGLAALAVGLALAGAASAHHAFNMYDNSKYTPLTGTVKSYSWKNPHVMIDFVAVDAGGQPEPWSVECSSPNIIGRHGWSSASLKAGDKVEMVVHPMKDGSHIALMVRVTTPAGAVLKDKM
ncbi:MAG: hypothetical protein JF588_04025 [Caulobacterales bacterium]|nr:hypothetical protein [Caulobacterales bacterium]